MQPVSPSPRTGTTPRRLVVIGNSGSGKTTFARAVAAALDVPHLELDSVYHQADWQPLHPPAFRARVSEFIDRSPAWVVDGNYSDVRDLLWTAADTVVWLDLPRRENFRSILLRTARRTIRRTVLWNGNRERLDNWRFFYDPERSILAWAWTQHGRYRERYAAAMADPRWAHLRILRATSRLEAQGWLQAWAAHSPPSELLGEQAHAPP